MDSSGGPHEVVNWLALDIGGTLAKVACVERMIPVERLKEEGLSVSRDERSLKTSGGDLLAFFLFSSREGLLSSAMAFLKLVVLEHYPLGTLPRPTIRATGGGAVKFASVIREELDADIIKVDEMDSLVSGLSLLLNTDGSLFRYNIKHKRRQVIDTTDMHSVEGRGFFPFLLCNIGSGVSILKVEGPDKYRRVSGTSVGGGTVLGLGSLMFNAQSFEEIIELSRWGDARRADLSVGDLMGTQPGPEHGMWSDDTLASSMGKLFTTDCPRIDSVSASTVNCCAGFTGSREDEAISSHPAREDLAQSLIQMVSYNIGYISYLVAKINKCSTFFFSGKYVNKHEPTMASISYAVEWYQQWGQPQQQNRQTDHIRPSGDVSDEDNGFGFHDPNSLGLPIPTRNQDKRAEAVRAALRPGLPPAVFTQLVTLAMRIGAPQELTKQAVGQLPPQLSFRDCAELIRRLTFEGLDSEAEGILPRAMESLSTTNERRQQQQQPKDVLCVVLSSTKSATNITDEFLNRLIDKGLLNEWNIPEVCKLIAISGHREAILPVAQLLILKYLGITFQDAELNTLGMVLRTLADIRDLGVMRLARIDDVLLRFPIIANKWFIEVPKPDLVEFATAAHGFASLAPSNLLEWRAPQVCNTVANIAHTSLLERPSTRSLSTLLWSVSRLAALTTSNPLSPEKARQILLYLADDSSATSGDIVIAVWSLAKTVGHFSDFIEPLTVLIDRLHAPDVPKFAWALSVGFGSRDSLSTDGLLLIERCVQLARPSQLQRIDTICTTVSENSKLIDTVMLWDASSLAGLREADMPPKPDLAELIHLLKHSDASEIRHRLTAGHVGPVTTGRLLDLLGILHCPYVPRCMERRDRGFRQPTAKYITCEVELSIDGRDTDAFVIDGGAKSMPNIHARSDITDSIDDDASGMRDPPHELLTGLYVINDRSSHAELSALNMVSGMLSNNSKGWLHLHVSHFPCLSCIYAMLKFCRAFEGIQVSPSLYRYSLSLSAYSGNLCATATIKVYRPAQVCTHSSHWGWFIDNHDCYMSPL
ncbi:hypothetical protein FOL47_000662 [Perkinsus chesapeaki]|uniref:Pantothenate kinase 1 n=1 Tax=Perkinsus chesapeaki TaxID=330153 RepID=A0A7J6MLI7_PERCH|nr:hypothetical protein FOL47_000662 [Perkinsus chesapeaki]